LERVDRELSREDVDEMRPARLLVEALELARPMDVRRLREVGEEGTRLVGAGLQPAVAERGDGRLARRRVERAEQRRGHVVSATAAPVRRYACSIVASAYRADSTDFATVCCKV